MMESNKRAEGLPLWLQGLGWLMRRMPRGPRKLEHWWWLLFQRLGCGRHFFDPGERDWPKEMSYTVRGRHGVMMVTSLSHWVGRWHYFRGSFYQDDIVLLLETLIRRGDIVVDAGANYGMITCLAARLAGPSGSIYAFEPNPDSLETIHHAIKINKFYNVNLFELGLSDREGRATMMAHPNPSEAWVALDGLPEGEKGHVIRLVKGDDVLGDLKSSRPVIVKMDVEGHEVQALRGLSRLLERRELALICEINRRALERAGSSPDELLGFMKSRGFDAFRFETHQSRWRRMPRLIPLEQPRPEDNYDALFIRRGTSLWRRINPD
jgi:FkbM family methyltransferase